MRKKKTKKLPLYVDDTPICGNNGCEIITEFLENEQEKEPSEDEKNKLLYEEMIDICRRKIESYKEGIWALKHCVEEEEIEINKYKNKISIITGDEDLFRSSFIDTIEN